MEWTWTTEKPVKRVFPSLYTWADVFGPRLHRFPGRPAVFQSADPSDGSESTSEDDKDRPRVSEHTRLILHIVAVVVVIAAVIGVVLAIVYGLPQRDNEDTITTTTKPIAHSTLRVDGQWSDWDPWSGCTKTCGSGTKSRNRLCNDPEPLNGGSNCTGKSEETVDCATWGCPDCSKQCPAGGTLSQDCSVCECNVSPINGRVVYIYNSTTLPLDDVKVYVVGHEWKPWTSTDRTGRFSIEGLCWNDTKLFYLDDDYLTEVTKYAVPDSGNITVEMVKKVTPKFLSEPADATVFVGDPVTFHCNATGVPQPDKYEWLKDGSIMDQTGNTLKISSTSSEDTGLYRCRASSKFAKKLSKIALLQVKEDKADTCDSVPTVLDVTLPAGCNVTLDGTNVTKVNVGECPSESCVSRDDKTTGRCCVPLNTDDIEVECETHNYTMKKVLSCGCGQCEIGGEVDVTGNVNVRKMISGNSTLVPVNASLFVPGYEIDTDDSNTTGNGFFSFSATPDAGRITVRFYQENNTDFLPQTIVIDVPRDVSSVTRNVVLQAKPEAVPLNAASGGAVNMSSVDGSPSVTIPPNSIVDADGNPYTGPVKVYPTFADPRDLDSISEAPGDFSFENEEGESQALQTNGVLGLFFEDDNGNPLQLSGKTTLTIDPDSLGIGKTKDGQPDSYVWTLDADTGKWKMSAPLTYASRRKKRDIFSTNSVVVSLVIPYPLPYINLDKPALRRVRCKLIIQVYADLFFTQPLTDLSLQVVTMTPNGAIYIGYTMGYTNRKGRACVTVMCGFRHIIILKPILGQPMAHPVHHLPAGFGFTNIGQGKVMFNSPSVYTIPDDRGPLIRDTNWQGWWKCYRGDSSQYHFKFAVPILYWPGFLIPVQYAPSRRLSWYQQPGNSASRRACMVQIRIETLFPGETRVIGTSRYGNAEGDSFGTYVTGVNPTTYYWMPYVRYENVACVQVKCPGDVTDGSSVIPDVATEVELKIIHQRATCKFRFNNVANKYCCDGDRAYNVTDTSDYNMRMRITPPRKRCRWSWAPGYYEATGTYQSAYRKVLRQCLRSWSTLGLFDCTGETMPRGWWNRSPYENARKYDPYRWEPKCETTTTTTTTTPTTTTPTPSQETPGAETTATIVDPKTPAQNLEEATEVSKTAAQSHDAGTTTEQPVDGKTTTTQSDFTSTTTTRVAPVNGDTTTIQPGTAGVEKAKSVTGDTTTIQPGTAGVTNAKSVTGDTTTVQPGTAGVTKAKPVIGDTTTIQLGTAGMTKAKPVTGDTTTIQPGTAGAIEAKSVTGDTKTIQPGTAGVTAAESVMGDTTTIQSSTAAVATDAGSVTGDTTTVQPGTAGVTEAASVTVVTTTVQPGTEGVAEGETVTGETTTIQSGISADATETESVTRDTSPIQPGITVATAAESITGETMIIQSVESTAAVEITVEQFNTGSTTTAEEVAGDPTTEQSNIGLTTAAQSVTGDVTATDSDTTGTVTPESVTGDSTNSGTTGTVTSESVIGDATNSDTTGTVKPESVTGDATDSDTTGTVTPESLSGDATNSDKTGTATPESVTGDVTGTGTDTTGTVTQDLVTGDVMGTSSDTTGTVTPESVTGDAINSDTTGTVTSESVTGDAIATDSDTTETVTPESVTGDATDSDTTVTATPESVTSGVIGTETDTTGTVTQELVTGGVTGTETDTTGTVTPESVTGDATNSNTTVTATLDSVTGDATTTNSDIAETMTPEPVTGDVTATESDTTGTVTTESVTGDAFATDSYTTETVIPESVTGDATDSNTTVTVTPDSVTGDATATDSDITETMTPEPVTGDNNSTEFELETTTT